MLWWGEASGERGGRRVGDSKTRAREEEGGGVPRLSDDPGRG